VQENRIQQRTCSWEEVRADTIRFCRDALAHDAPPDAAALEPGTYLQEIAVGYPEFRRFLFRTEYTWDRLRGDAQRVIEIIESL
jgi:hypothetical protein